MRAGTAALLGRMKHALARYLACGGSGGVPAPEHLAAAAALACTCILSSAAAVDLQAASGSGAPAAAPDHTRASASGADAAAAELAELPVLQLLIRTLRQSVRHADAAMSEMALAASAGGAGRTRLFAMHEAATDVRAAPALQAPRSLQCTRQAEQLLLTDPGSAPQQHVLCAALHVPPCTALEHRRSLPLRTACISVRRAAGARAAARQAAALHDGAPGAAHSARAAHAAGRAPGRALQERARGRRPTRLMHEDLAIQLRTFAVGAPASKAALVRALVPAASKVLPAVSDRAATAASKAAAAQDLVLYVKRLLLEPLAAAAPAGSIGAEARAGRPAAAPRCPGGAPHRTMRSLPAGNPPRQTMGCMHAAHAQQTCGTTLSRSQACWRLRSAPRRPPRASTSSSCSRACSWSCRCRACSPR